MSELKCIKVSLETWRKLQMEKILKGYKSVEEIIKERVLNGSDEAGDGQTEREGNNNQDQNRGEQGNSGEGAVESFEIE